jgi:uncharacterized protein
MTVTNEYEKPLPDLDNPDMKPFWAATRESRLIAPKCLSCDQFRWPPTPICGACLSEDTQWVDVSRQGAVWSYAIYHRAFHPGFKQDLPYVVAVVENAEGLHFVGNITGSREGLAVGAPVAAVFDPVTPEVTLVKWRIVPAGSTAS